MSQTNKIFFALLFGYIVYTTLNGNLREWLILLGLKDGSLSNKTIVFG